MQSTLTAADITMLRFGTAAIIVLPWAIRYPWRTVNWFRCLVVTLGCGFPYTMLSFWGVQFNAAANAGVIVNGSLPVVTAITALILTRSVPKLALVWTTTGLFLANGLMLFGGSSGWAIHFAGLALLITAAFVLSTYMTMVKHWGIGLKDIIVWVPIVNAVLFLPIWALSGSQIASTPIDQVMLQVVHQGIIVSVGALLLFTFTVKSLGAMNASFFMAFVPVVTTVIGALVLGEVPSYGQWLGGAVCTITLVIYQCHQL